MSKVWIVHHAGTYTWGSPFVERYAFSTLTKAQKFITDRNIKSGGKWKSADGIHFSEESGESYLIEEIAIDTED